MEVTPATHQDTKALSFNMIIFIRIFVTFSKRLFFLQMKWRLRNFALTLAVCAKECDTVFNKQQNNKHVKIFLKAKQYLCINMFTQWAPMCFGQCRPCPSSCPRRCSISFRIQRRCRSSRRPSPRRRPPPPPSARRRWWSRSSSSSARWTSWSRPASRSPSPRAPGSRTSFPRWWSSPSPPPSASCSTCARRREGPRRWGHQHELCEAVLVWLLKRWIRKNSFDHARWKLFDFFNVSFIKMLGNVWN